MVFPFPSACLAGIRLEMTDPPYHAVEIILDLIWDLLEHEAKFDESGLVVRSDRLLGTYGLCLEMNIFFGPYPLTYRRIGD